MTITKKFDRGLFKKFMIYQERKKLADIIKFQDCCKFW